MLKAISIFIALLYGITVKAQTPDSALKKSPVKTLSDKQYTALLNGDDQYNMALVAELNHYPLPDKVLKYKKELDLSPVQITKISALSKELRRKKLEMGVFVIRNERALDSVFRKRNVYDGDVLYYVNRSGLYYGELRNAMVQACLSTGNLLAPQQVKKLETLENH